MKRSVVFISLLLLLPASHVAYSRSIREDLSPEVGSEGKPPAFVEWSLSATTETCEPTYGFLPCSTNVWGLLFLIVVYEILLSFGGKYVAKGSELFFQIIGPGVVGSSLFQFLGTIPQIVLVLASALSGSVEAAQQRATLGVGLVAGTTVMLLTLIWGVSVVLGSYDLSEATVIDRSGRHIKTRKGYGVVTDYETSYTARIILITLIPFLIILLAKCFQSSAGKRVIILIALIVTAILLFAYILSQIFQPWIRNRRFEYLMNKYAKDKLLTLLSKNGKPDPTKIQHLFDKIDKNKNGSVSPSELRVLLLGLKIEDDDLGTDRDVETVLESFDTNGDGVIRQNEFTQGMSKLVTDLSDQNPDRIKMGGGSKPQNNNPLQQSLVGNGTPITPNTKAGPRPNKPGNSWLNYFLAAFYVMIGIVMLCALSEPLIKSVVMFSQVANLSSFCVSYLAIPFAMNYGVAVQSIFSAREKTQKSISLTLSALYGGVYMNNIIGLIVFLAPVYARNLKADAFAPILVVVIICVLMTVVASFRTTFYRWMGYLVLSLYPISLALIYVVTAVLGWS